eukprot:SM000092S24513  [mRNA]  locus=s92:457565:463186:+ [translate_table: standard]
MTSSAACAAPVAWLPLQQQQSRSRRAVSLAHSGEHGPARLLRPPTWTCRPIEQLGLCNVRRRPAGQRRRPAAAAVAALVADFASSSPGRGELQWDGERRLATQPLALPEPPADSSIQSVLPYLWALASGDRTLRWRLAVALVLLVAGKAAGLAGPLLFKQGLDGLAQAGSLSLGQSAVHAAVAALVMSGISKALSALFNEVRYVVFTPVGQATGRRVALQFFEHILAMDVAFHLERKTGGLSRIIDRGKRSVTMIFRAVGRLHSFPLPSLLPPPSRPTFLFFLCHETGRANEGAAWTGGAAVFTFIPTAVELALVCGLLAKQISPAFAGVVLLTFVAYVAWTIALTKAAAASRKEVNRLDNLTTGKVVDALLNYETVVQFNNEQLEAEQYDDLLRSYQQASVEAEYISAKLNGGQALILALGVATVMAMAGMRVAKGIMTAGDLVLANGLILQLSVPLQFLGFLYRDLRQSLVDMDAMFTILRTKSALRDGDVELEPSGRGAKLRAYNIEFGYTPARQVLKGVSFVAEPGQSIAIVGPSGSGKSTIVKLLLRLYDPQAGTVYLDNHEIRSLTMASLRSAVAVVPQDTVGGTSFLDLARNVLFNDTIGANIRYGRPSAKDEEVEEAAKQAKLYDAIKGMPDGFETMVGERGLKLSGGEKQRVAIARAFLKAPRLLICDEATSALDSPTEAAILKSLKELAKGRTCLFVAHRLSTIMHCDKIIVMEAGVVVEQGTHRELLSRSGTYAHMWTMQEAEEPSDGELNGTPLGTSANGNGAAADDHAAGNHDGRAYDKDLVNFQNEKQEERVGIRGAASGMRMEDYSATSVREAGRGSGALN